MSYPAFLQDRQLLCVAGSAIALRLLVFLVVIIGGHLSLAQYTAKGDTPSYLGSAAAMCGERSVASLSEYDARVFPGYPALIAIIHRLGIPPPMAAIAVTWLSAAVAAMAMGKFFSDARIGWAMTCLIPHYLINSSLGMSEAPLLAVIGLALLASQREKFFLAGILFGFSGVIRPMACFALAGLVLTLILNRQWKPMIVILLATLGMFTVEALAYQRWTGDALRGVRAYATHRDAYAGHLLAWPFQSLLTTPRHDGASLGKIIYIWIHVVVVLSACSILAKRVIRAGRHSPRSAIAFVWLMGNTAFALCIGSVWGFRHFPRFMIPAEPAMFWALLRFLPGSRWWWASIAIVCGIVAVFGVINSR